MLINARSIMVFATQGYLLRYCHILALYLELSGKRASESNGAVEDLLPSSEITSFVSAPASIAPSKSRCEDDRHVLPTNSVCGGSRFDGPGSSHHHTPPAIGESNS